MTDITTTDIVYYCQAGGHYWTWYYSSEHGGIWYPAHLDDTDVTEDDVVIHKYCGCND